MHRTLRYTFEITKEGDVFAIKGEEVEKPFEVTIDSYWIYDFRFPNNEDLWIEQSMASLYDINENGEVTFSIINLKNTEEPRKEGMFKYNLY